MWEWVLSGTCLLRGVVLCRVVGVVGGGRDLSWERIPLAEGQCGYDVNDLSLKLEGISSGVCEHGSCLVPVSLGGVVPFRVTGVSVGGRDLSWERIPLVEDQAWV